MNQIIRNQIEPKLIHVASMQAYKQGRFYLLLRQIDSYRYLWFEEKTPGIEKETSIWGGSAEEAMLAGYRIWKEHLFHSLHCGFRYTLPERDEVGTNALFHQMIASYSSINGVYFDEDLGLNCIVQYASIEARNLWQRLQQQAYSTKLLTFS